MSDSADMHSDNEAARIPKKDKKAKKSKRDKKDKEEQLPLNTSAAASPQDDEPTPSSNKRKREILPDEIEIDVSLPEPASKKAARKAKKAKTTPSATTKDTANADGTADADAAKADPTKRSDFSVWIGNLPWSANKDTLRTFLTSNSVIKTEEITRIHMPAPKAPPRPNWTDAKPQNKGFAYVDFSTQLAMYAAIALTETRMDNRPLLIKNSKNFEGRPDKPKEDGEEVSGPAGRGGRGKEEKPPSQKVFVGNLGFETTKEDLEAHFKPCGTVEHIHMATFEDTGKCKGFAWVRFTDVEAATAAVKGYIYKKEKKARDETGSDEDEDAEKEDGGKKRKYHLNKLLGRDLRCEFAEDATTRYQKRYGKEKDSDEGFDEVREEGVSRAPKKKAYMPPTFKKKLQEFNNRKVDPRNIKPGAAHSNAPRASAAIVASKGKRTTFE